jgi:hypothetical protein
MEKLEKSSGGYMSVDPAAAVEHNRPVIEQIKQTVQHAPPPQPEQNPGQSGSTPSKK